MDTQTILAVATSMLIALAAVGEVVFKFWRERQRSKKRPRK